MAVWREDVEVEVLTPLHKRPYAPGLMYLSVEFRVRVNGDVFVFLVGFVWDGTSTPRPLWWWSPPHNGWSDVAGLVHDGFCRYWKMLGISKVWADSVFVALMEQAVDAIPVGTRRERFARWRLQQQARMKFGAVRLFGWVVLGPGDGTPPGKVRRAMGLRGGWPHEVVEVRREPVR